MVGDGTAVAPPFIVAAHATGFCKDVFTPIVDDLAAVMPAAEVVAFDHRGHGDSDPIRMPLDWWDMGRDVLAVVGGRTGVVGVGHSGGAAAIIMAEVLAPGTFRSLVLAEPVTLPGPYARREDEPLVEAARKRRTTFESPQAALENFRPKPAFRGWDPRILAAYVHHALRAGPDGWELKCDTSGEAEVYATGHAHGAWERLGEVRCPTLVLVGEHNDLYPGDLATTLTDRFGDGTLRVVADTGHFLVMQSPATIVDAVCRQVARDTRKPPDDR